MENKAVAKSNKKIIAIILVAVIALVGVYFFVLKKNSSPKSIFTKAINKEYEKFMDAVDVDEKKIDEKAVVVEQKLDFDIDIDKSIVGSDADKMIKELNKLGLTVKTGVDTKKEQAIIDLATTYDKKDLVAVAAYLTGDKLYVELKDMLEKYIEVDLDSTEVFKSNPPASLTAKDAEYLIETTKDALLDSVEEKQFKKTSEKIEVNGKETKVSKITLGLSEKDANSIAIKFLNKIKGDKKYIKILAKSANVDEKELKEQLAETVKELKDADGMSTEDQIFISVYAKGNNPIGYEISTEEAAIRIVEDNKNKATITIISGEMEIPFVLEKIVKGKTTEYKMSLDYQGIDASISLKSEEIKKDSQYKLALVIKAMDMVDVKITDEIKVEYKDKLDMPNFKDTVKFENLSEEDYNKIMTKLSNNKVFMDFAEALGSL